MAHTNWEADKMMDVYIYDYLLKRNFQASAKAFQAEAKVSSDPVAIDAPGGFLLEWWSVFWDIFIARTSDKNSEAASAYIETQVAKAREQQLTSQQHQQQQLQLQQILLQRQVQQQHLQQQQQLQQQKHLHQQQQRREGTHTLAGGANGLVNGDSLLCQNSGTANAMATKMYEEGLKFPPKESSDDPSIKSFGENSRLDLVSNQMPMVKSASIPGQPSGQLLHGTIGGLSGTGSAPQVLGRNSLLSGSTQDNKSEMTAVLNSNAGTTDGSLVGVPGSNSGGNQLTLKGWPLTGFDQLRSGISPQRPFLQSPQPFSQLPILTQRQRQLMLQAQLNMPSQSPGDIDCRRLRMYLNTRNAVPGKDFHANSVGDVISNAGSSTQTVCQTLPRGDSEMLMKKIAQLQQQHQQQSGGQQFQQHAVSSQQSQGTNSQLQQQDKMAASSVTVEGSMPNTFRGNDQVAKGPAGRKRKQPVSSGLANSSGTANTSAPSPSSAPSTPSTHTPGDAISVPSLQQNCPSTKPLLIFGSDGSGALNSPSNPLWDDKGELLGEVGSLEENVESFLSQDDGDIRDTVGRFTDASKAFTFNEIGHIRASTSKVVCCHFSSDGKLLATGGHDKKAVLWSTDSLKTKSTLEEHTMMITDVRFSPNMPRVATTSFDKTVRVWDADNPGYSIRTFTGHSSAVMSLDFHPSKDDLICSCDGDGEIRYWSVNIGNCSRVTKGGTKQLRFRPRGGRHLAAAAENVVSILDVETQACCHSLQGHAKLIHSVCWDPSGEYLASVSEDSVRVWSLSSGSEGDCVHELTSNGNKFHSCVFHPTYPSLLVIGCYQSLELWNMVENKTMALPAHDGLIAALAVSYTNGLVASASHDKFVKIWK